VGRGAVSLASGMHCGRSCGLTAPACGRLGERFVDKQEADRGWIIRRFCRRLGFYG
jgi:hypothetical protein